MHDARIVRDVIVIGASTGGNEAITQLLAQWPSDLKATIGIVIHRGANIDDWSSSRRSA
jgi:chemotaxis response regulator CheB